MTASQRALHRRRLGSFGETLAASFLTRHGVRIVERNVSVGRGELDIIASEAGTRFAVEVKTAIATAGDHPRHHFTRHKARQVAELAAVRSIRRVDLVTVVVAAHGVQIDWHRRV